MEINLGKIPFDLDFHPTSPLVAVGLISGDFHLYQYASDAQPKRLLEIRAHNESSRALRFVDSGRVILTGSPDCSMLASDVETGKAIARLDEAHGDAINRLVNLTETTVASGDDEGCIKVWDTRQRTCCNTFSAHEDYVSDLYFVSDTMQLLGTSGDGTLSVFNLRKNKIQSQSEFSEDELLSLVVMKSGRKVICGTQTGALLLYSWGHFKDCSDRFLGHPMSVDTLLKLDEDTHFWIRRWSDQLWDLQELLDNHNGAPDNQMVETDSDDEEMDVDVKPLKSTKGTARKKSGKGQTSSSSVTDFFADL